MLLLLSLFLLFSISIFIMDRNCMHVNRKQILKIIKNYLKTTDDLSFEDQDFPRSQVKKIENDLFVSEVALISKH